MDESRLTRRSLLTSAGLSLVAATAGCTLETPQATQSSSTSTDESGFPQEFKYPEETAEPEPNSRWAEVFQELVGSVVGVQVDEAQPGSGGSAWVYDETHLVTNEHITRLEAEPYVWFKDAGWREATVVGEDRHSDLGVLEVSEKPDSAQPLSLVDQPPAVGTPVAAIGNPFDLTASFTSGVISGRNRTIDLPERSFSIADGVQFDAAVNPGNSGGPLVTTDGEVAGVVSAGQGDNVGFAISASLAKNVIPALIKDGNYEHTYLGVFLQDVTPGIVEAHDTAGYTWGVYVHEVLVETPASGVLQGSTDTEVVRETEIPVGGDIIVRMDDQPIQTREDLSSYLALQTDPGDTIDIDVIRNGEVKTVSVTLASRPEDGV
jgi:serine protease Do